MESTRPIQLELGKPNVLCPDAKISLLSGLKTQADNLVRMLRKLEGVNEGRIPHANGRRQYGHVQQQWGVYGGTLEVIIIVD